MMALKVIIAITVLSLSIFVAYQLVDRFDPDTVKGKNVIITGSSTGIGEQLAYQYARLGANILITARRERQLKQVVEKCKEIGRKNGKYHFISLDMLDEGAPLKLINHAEKTLGSIDYVILNHALPYHLGEWLGSDDNFTALEKTFMANFNSYVRIASHTTRLLEESRGSLIVMSSTAGKMPMPYIAPYSASKHALQVIYLLKWVDWKRFYLLLHNSCYLS